MKLGGLQRLPSFLQTYIYVLCGRRTIPNKSNLAQALPPVSADLRSLGPGRLRPFPRIHRSDLSCLLNDKSALYRVDYPSNITSFMCAWTLNGLTSKWTGSYHIIIIEGTCLSRVNSRVIESWDKLFHCLVICSSTANRCRD